MTAVLTLSFMAYKFMSSSLLRKGAHRCPQKGLLLTSGWAAPLDTTPYGVCAAKQCWKYQAVGQGLLWATLFRFYHVAVETEGYNMNFVFMAVVFEGFIISTMGFL
jgi:hypothetical protein